MTRFPEVSGGGGAYTYAQDGFPEGAEEGETLYHVTENKSYVFDSVDWIEQTVTDHGQLSGISATDHHAPIPSGVITMWSGTTSDVPSGWVLCNGNNGTPDLRDRFIAGAGGQYSAGATGGADSVQLSESEMPSHTHGLESQVGAYASSYAASGGSSDKSGTNDDASSVNTTSAGGDSAHENRPPFYALAFIMKV